MCPTRANKTVTNQTLFPLPLHNHASSLPYCISLKGFINSVEIALRVKEQNTLLLTFHHSTFRTIHFMAAMAPEESINRRH